MIVPWEVDVPQDRYPVVNWLIIAAIAVILGLMISAMLFAPDEHHTGLSDSEEPQFWFSSWVLNDWSIKGLFGHMWLHAGILHCLGNVLFLWIFGNAVCAKIGNVKYLLLYIFFGLVAGAAHLLFAGGSVVGASGAIYGIVGMYLVFFPENEITCYWIWWFLLVPRITEFSLSSYWMILFWVAFDIFGAISGGGGRVAYFAHIGGFAGGVITAVILLKTKLVVMQPRYEKSLLQLLDERFGRVKETPGPGDFLVQQAMESAQSQPGGAPEPPSIELPDWPIEERKVAVEDVAAPTVQVAPRRPATPPETPQFIRFVCACGKKVKIPARYAGRVGKCPQCSKQLRIPNLPPAV